MARILVHDASGHPFQVQLSRELARRGHQVLHVYSASLQTPRGDLERRPGDPSGFEVLGIALRRPVQKYRYLVRMLQEREYAHRLASEARAFRPDVVLSGNAQPYAQDLLCRTAHRQGARFVFWLQDVWGVGAERVLGRRWGALGRLAARPYAAREAKALRRSDAVVAITDDFRPLLGDWGVERERITTIPNWAPLHELSVAAQDNTWAREHGLVGRHVVLYAGTLGLKHDPELLVGLALDARDDPEVRIVVVSEGLGADYLARRRAELGLDGLVLLPFQPFRRLPEVLGTAAVLVTLLEPDAGVFSVPSKVLSNLCAGRPLLLAVPAGNLAARIVTGAAAGLVVDPADRAGFVAAARRLRSQPDLRTSLGAAGRRYAEATFDLETIADRFEIVLGTATSPEGSK